MRIWSPPAESGLVMRFSGSYASVPQRTDVFGLVSLSDYYRFLTDDQGQLRSYLFEANVRDYEGMFQSTKESGKRWSILAKTISGGSTTG